MLLAVNVLALAVDVQPAGAGTSVVPDDYPTIQEAVYAAEVGDTILVLNGTYPEHLVINKSLSVVGESRSATIIDGSITITSDNVNINGFTIVHGKRGRGIWISSSSGCTISHNNITSCGEGISIGASSYNNIVGNTITKNAYGIELGGGSNDNTITKNHILKNAYSGIDILYGSSYNKIANNTISYNWNGIMIQRGVSSPRCIGNVIMDNVMSNSVNIIVESCCSDSKIIRNRMRGWGIDIGPSFLSDVPCNATIMNNTITNGRYGIFINARYVGAHFNDVVGNTVINCDCGIYFRRSSNNTVYHNNFVNNTVQANVDESQAINWDGGYPSGGNYWSDHACTDIYSGRHQNGTGSDGIGDGRYVIDEDNWDSYPLMHPWPPIDIDANRLNLKSKDKWIAAYIELPWGYNMGDIEVFTILLNASVPVDKEAPVTIGDHDNDGILDLRVNFNRSTVSQYILDQNITYGNVTLTLSGVLHSVEPFEGSDTIRVSALVGDVNCDGEVDLYDVVEASASYGARQGEPDWNPNINFAPDWHIIDLYDLVTCAYHYGETA